MSPRAFMPWAAFAAMSCAFDWDGYDPRLRPGATEGPCEPGTTRACYSGPPGTEGVSGCHGGTQSCGVDQVFGPCEGEVIPIPEVCITTMDEDCDGVVLDPEDGCGCTAGELVACYDGAMETDGVGMCQEGHALCNAEGNGFASACVGQVQPMLEECASAADDDCNGAANDWCASWSLRFPGAGDQTAWGAALNGADLLLAGQVSGDVDFGTGLLSAVDFADAFVAKLDAVSGTVSWARLYGGTGYQTANAIAFDAAGDLYVAGQFDVGFDPGGVLTPLVATEGLDAFVMKIDGSDGTPLWLWHGAGTLDQNAKGVAVDGAGQVVVTGAFSGTADLAAMPLVATADDGFVSKLDASGALAWGMSFGAAGDDAGNDVAVDAAGNIHLAGFFAEEIDLGGGPVADLGGVDGFVARLGPTGAYQWLKPFGGAADTFAYAIALGSDGSVHVTGEFWGSSDFGAGPVTSSGDSDTFVVKLTSAGAHDWQTMISGSAADESKDIAVGPNDEVVVGMDLYGNVSVKGELVLNAGEGDFGVVLMDAAGAAQVVRRFGVGSNERLRRVLVPAGNSLLFEGDCEGDLDFGAGLMLGPDGSYDICVVRLEP